MGMEICEREGPVIGKEAQPLSAGIAAAAFLFSAIDEWAADVPTAKAN